MGPAESTSSFKHHEFLNLEHDFGISREVGDEFAAILDLGGGIPKYDGTFCNCAKEKLVIAHFAQEL